VLPNNDLPSAATSEPKKDTAEKVKKSKKEKSSNKPDKD
jgi:hypothetical protein